MKSPSFAFNSVDVPGPSYRMSQWMEGYRGFTAASLVSSIVAADDESRRQTGQRLLNIVINAHGAGGYVSIAGQRIIGLNNKTASEFLRLKNRNLGTIWLVACKAADGDYGAEFCSILARNSNCLVIASNETQEVGAWGTWRLRTSAIHNHIDEFEGNVYSFTPNGGRRLIDPQNDQGLITTTDWDGGV